MKWIRTHILFIIQSLVFSLISLSFIIPNGNFHCLAQTCTLSIGSWHIHDALWHISLTQLGFTSWPLQNPFMSGESILGYNFLLDYILNRFLSLGISPFLTFFKLLPLIATILYVYSVWSYIKSVTTSKFKSNLLGFFLYFGSSTTYLATLYADQTFYYATLKGFPVVSVINPTSMFLNLQFAFSLSIFLWIMILAKKTTSWKNNMSLIFLFFLMFGFKFYGGVVALVYYLGIKSIELFEIKSFSSFTQFAPALIGSYLGLLVFYGLSTNRQIPFTWSPFSLTHLMIDDKLLFWNHNLTLARYYLYENATGFSPRLWAIESLSIILFLIINFGTRVIGLIYVIAATVSHKISKEQFILFIVILLTALAPILFVQNGGWYNTMQFLYYGAWLAGLLTVEFIFRIVKLNVISHKIILIIVIILTIPNCLEQLRFLTAKQEIISADEMSMLEILKKEDYGVVHISESVHKLALVPALAHKPTFYLDTDQLMVTHANYIPRLAFMEKYGGGSMTTVPADYYLVYKDDYGAQAAIKSLTSPTQYRLIYNSEKIALYKKL